MTKKIAICGVFDMNNYGDLLFPLVAEHRLKRHGFIISPYAPSTLLPELSALPPEPISKLMLGSETLDGVMIGGGYIIHNQPISKLLNYQEANEADQVSNATWLGATLSACLADIPIVWNAPGVPFPFPKQHHAYLKAVMSASSYLSVRDTGSARLLPRRDEEELAIVPDPVAELSKVWSVDDLSTSFSDFRDRHRIEKTLPLLVINIRHRSLSGLGQERLGRLIDEFAKATDLLPVLLPLGEAHDDTATALSVSRHIAANHTVYSDPSDLKEITSVIAHAALYVGASLHGYIAATAYAVPSVLVAKPAYTKFRGYLEHTGWLDDLTHDWQSAFGRASVLFTGSSRRRLPETVFAALDRHWSRIRDELSDRHRHTRRRQAFLGALLHEGMILGGTRWLLEPFMFKKGKLHDN
ncbi:MAG: polysaccharide pyruvyl transferase family protein [Gammaproteobacteria bacterium]